MAHPTTRFDIVSGTSKFDLMASVFDRKLVFITLKGKKDALSVIFFGVSQEDGSCNNWIVKGYVTIGPDKSKKFKGFYKTDLRTGFLELDQ